MWIYRNTRDNKARFVLGQKGDRPLICFGVNPSTAIPGNLDLTLKQVQRKSVQNGFDGWIMLNLYPQRATFPRNLDTTLIKKLHKTNLQMIKGIFSKRADLIAWAAWGGLIQKRSYLKNCLLDIAKVIPNANWVHVGPLVDKKHPHHPLYLNKGLPFKPFDMRKYLENIKH
jgi:hypothetical protein